MQRPYRQHLLNTYGGFITDKEHDLKSLIQEDRLQSVLVRCGGGRFACPAQDVEHFIRIIARDAADYVRDLSVTKENW